MANYCCTTRTNYFHVKDEAAFLEMMNRVCGSEDSINLWKEKDSNGQTVFGFGTYGCIAGLINDPANEDDDDREPSYDAFIIELQKCVADDDAIIILESGNEKMRYVIGTATIITSQNYEYLDITDISTKKAAEMLGNPNWETKCAY